MTLDELEKEFISDKHRQVKQDRALNDSLITIGNNVLDVKHKQDKFTNVLFGILFFAGVLVGMQSKIWIPYAKNMVDIFKTVNNVKGVQ